MKAPETPVSTTARSDDDNDKATQWAFNFFMGMLGIAVILMIIALFTF